jgi:uncharacterized SAM-binding protein YcdF (DUF218 family)
MIMRKKHRRRAVSLLPIVLVLPAVSWAAYVALQVVSVGNGDDPHPSDAIVVLGTWEDEGWPSDLFGARLDHALSLYKEGVAPLVIVAGGDPEGDSYTEAAAGTRYLEYRGLPDEVVLTVGGNNTYENLREVRALAQQQNIETMLVVSDRFHMFRSLSIAEDLELQVYGSPTTTSPVEAAPAWRLYYTLREVAAYSAYVLGLRSPTPA